MLRFKKTIALLGLLSVVAAYDPTSGTSLLNHNLYSRSAEGAAPVQHRLAYHGSTGMRISWSTYEQLESPTVQFGLSPHTLFFHKSSGSQASTTYPTSRTWNNHVTLEALLPNTKYYYKVSNSKSDQIYSFKTPKIRGDRTVSC